MKNTHKKRGPEEPVEETDVPVQDGDAEAAAPEAEPEIKKGKKGHVKTLFGSGKTSQKKEEKPDDRFLRLQADFENYRKRILREREDLYRRSNEDLLTELLPVVDHLDLALGSVAEKSADEGFVEGVRLVSEQLLSALRKFGLAPIDAEGQEFDPNLHEAISHLPSEDVSENIVMTQTRKGYKLGDKLLRPAQVVVSRGGALEPGVAEPEPKAPTDEALNVEGEE